MSTLTWLSLAYVAYLVGSRLRDYAATCGPPEPGKGAVQPRASVRLREAVQSSDRTHVICPRCARGEVVKVLLAQDDPEQLWDVVVVRYPPEVAAALRAQYEGSYRRECLAG